MAEARNNAVDIRGLWKTFGDQVALHDVSFVAPAGAVTALLGENGSGKSTLIKTLAGVHQRDRGEITLNGERMGPHVDAVEAHRLGLRFVHQDRGLIDALSVLENFGFADRARRQGLLAPIRRAAEGRRIGGVLGRLGIEVSPRTQVKMLDPTTRTMVAIARAVQDWEFDGAASGVLILDEPTAALPAREVERVLELVRSIRSHGGSVIYVSHRLDEIMQVADQVVILRDGRVVAAEPLGELDKPALIERILGRKADFDVAPRDVGTGAAGRPLLVADAISANRLSEVSFDVSEGEIFGIAGLVGCGRSELCRVIGGAQQFSGGRFMLAGEQYVPRGPAAAVASGVSYVPQDRPNQGVLGTMTLQDNVTLGTVSDFVNKHWLSLKRERREVSEVARSFAIRPALPERMMWQFSGGNQQKAVLARAIRRKPRLLVLDEPFQGIDIGAKAEISQLIRGLADQGIAVVVASTDPEDLIGLCGRVLVLDRGSTKAIVSGDTLTVDSLTFISVKQEV